jgi:hypothetical protein
VVAKFAEELPQRGEEGREGEGFHHYIPVPLNTTRSKPGQHRGRQRSVGSPAQHMKLPWHLWIPPAGLKMQGGGSGPVPPCSGTGCFAGPHSRGENTCTHPVFLPPKIASTTTPQPPTTCFASASSPQLPSNSPRATTRSVSCGPRYSSPLFPLACRC